MVEFVKLILKIIPHRPEELGELIFGIYSLFREIDINEDGTMSLDEFVSHIIEAAEAQKDYIGGELPAVLTSNRAREQAGILMAKEES